MNQKKIVNSISSQNNDAHTASPINLLLLLQYYCITIVNVLVPAVLLRDKYPLPW